MEIAVLGATGMLGSMLVKYLSEYYEVVATVRDTSRNKGIGVIPFGVKVKIFDASIGKSLGEVVDDCYWIINAIGAIPQKGAGPYTINSTFPQQLALLDIPVIQIATDCVYNGKQGRYIESNDFSPVDDYGRSKLLGEVEAPNMHHLRCSIVGPEPNGSYSLLGWFLNLPRNAVIMGYTNHRWNGITTLHFAKVCKGIIENNIELPYMQHLIPSMYSKVTKYELLKLFAREFDREDIIIKPVEAPNDIDRTLGTEYHELNNELWQAAGYEYPPDIATMVKELAEYEKAFESLIKGI